MLPVIEKLLILQDRDRRIFGLSDHLARIGPERNFLTGRVSGGETALEKAKDTANHIESDRKKLELEVEAKKEQIEKYSLQQFQTKKNEEYRALAREIETCRRVIEKLEDEQLELMERFDAAQEEIQRAKADLDEARQVAKDQIAALDEREAKLREELAGLESEREERVTEIDGEVRVKYERLLKNKPGQVIVGVDHGVCGGCHVKLPTQIVVSCRGEKEIVFCPNCGRIVYYTRDMDLVASD